MKNKTFPKWSSPLVGLIAGGLIGLRIGMRAKEIGVTYFILGGMAIGAFAGTIIFFLDPKPSEEAHEEYLPAHLQTSTQENQSGLVGRFLAVTGLLTSLIPFLGLVVAAAGLIVNWKSSDWTRTLSMVATGLALVASLVVFSLLLSGR